MSSKILMASVQHVLSSSPKSGSTLKIGIKQLFKKVFFPIILDFLSVRESLPNRKPSQAFGKVSKGTPTQIIINLRKGVPTVTDVNNGLG